MKIRIFNITLLIVIFGLIGYLTGAFNALVKPSTAYAVGDLTVNWGVPAGQPIFNFSNLAPGDVQSHVVNVVNNAPSSRPVAVRGILTMQTNSLANVMDIVIRDGNTDVYGGQSSTGPKTLTQFFSDSNNISGISLSTINAGGNKNYSFVVTFEQTAGNQFQSSNTRFDLQLGIGFDLPAACQNIAFNKAPIFGTAGNDHIVGTNGNDLIVTFDGNDTVDGGNGNDCIVSGNGDNHIQGGNGSDVIVSGNGKNAIDGGNESDAISVGNGNNSIQGGNGDDKISAGSGNNTVDSGNGDDQVITGGGANKISGGNGNDSLITLGSSSSVDGGNGKDKCVANSKKNCEL